MQPVGYERDLLALQYNHSAGIFDCEEYGVYSNTVLQVAPGVFTAVVNSTLKCPMGGEFGTALNTGIFLAVWAKVVSDGRFLMHGWTAKVDPDAVFLPGRLRNLLAHHSEEEGTGVYLNNCKFGLHGPVEVFSRNAVRAWAIGAGGCVRHFTRLCSGACGWGEDMFIDQCMSRVVGSRRVDDFKVLLEDHCDPPKDWDSCADPAAAAFHPFKSAKGWLACLRSAQGAVAKPATPTDRHHLRG